MLLSDTAFSCSFEMFLRGMATRVTYILLRLYFENQFKIWLCDVTLRHSWDPSPRHCPRDPGNFQIFTANIVAPLGTSESHAQQNRRSIYRSPPLPLTFAINGRSKAKWKNKIKIKKSRWGIYSPLGILKSRYSIFLPDRAVSHSSLQKVVKIPPNIHLVLATRTSASIHSFNIRSFSSLQ